jgi:hypothetical protein
MPMKETKRMQTRGANGQTVTVIERAKVTDAQSGRSRMASRLRTLTTESGEAVTPVSNNVFKIVSTGETLQRIL